MDEEELSKLCVRDLRKIGIMCDDHNVVRYFSLRLEKAYPVYEIGWKRKFISLYNRLDSIKNLFIVGRKGLFLHCNIDHCIIQGLELANLILKHSHKRKDLWNKKIEKFMCFSARD